MQYLTGENDYKKKISWTNVIQTFVTCLVETSRLEEILRKS